MLHRAFSCKAAKQQLQKFKVAGFIKERQRNSTEPAVLVFARDGFNTFRKKGKFADYPQVAFRAMEKQAHVSTQPIHRNLEIMDVNATFCPANHRADRSIVAEFSISLLPHQFEPEPYLHGM